MRTRVHRSALVHAAAVLALAAGGALLTGAPRATAASAAAAETNCDYIDDAARPTVDPGSTGDAVRQVQCLINYYSGYPNWLEEDGGYGPRTLAGVHWVQTCNATTGGADGVVGPSTWSRLYAPKDACAISAL
ncbi:peptidoglycan-binding protein [Streptomyces sp. SID12488]|uniref:peptidoglycan-binding domain-containing protein n=1 Tax=Streptomyces sp. SID12488 TaxID=2706040 RepID=UPI0013DA3609|nr:peptidoglycan-binding protein [Streptomyces sp. SID12488]NEA61294.1 peptidoglycan-binding protein [Streptomyces sp. SID12488]